MTRDGPRDGRGGSLVLALLCLALWPAVVSGRDTLWNSYTEAGTNAYQQGRYAEAEQMLVAALREAEGFGPQDLRVAIGCNNLAELYRAQGRYTEAERLYGRALTIFERTQGSSAALLGLQRLRKLRTPAAA